MTARTPVPMPEARAAVELPEPDLSAARRRVERIRMLTLSVAENMEKLRALVREAKASSDHVALGYASWTAYIVDLFGEEPLRLTRDVRRELVEELHGQGMSTRAIAPIVGVDHATVARDVAAAEPAPVVVVEEVLVEPPLVGYDPQTGELTTDVFPTPADAPIVGLDGKAYPRVTAPRKPAAPRPEVTVEKVVEQIEAAMVAATEVSLLVFDAPDAEKTAAWARRLRVAETAVREFASAIERWHR